MEMYERFFTAVEDKSGACQPTLSMNVDVIEVSESLAGEIVKKLKLEETKALDFRTLFTFLLDGDGYKVWGPTAYVELCNLWLDEKAGYFSCSKEDCQKQFFPPEEKKPDAAAGDGAAGGDGAAAGGDGAAAGGDGAAGST